MLGVVLPACFVILEGLVGAPDKVQTYQVQMRLGADGYA